MDHLLADTAIRAADADVLVGATEAAHRVALEVREHEQRIVIQEMRADGHLREPLAALDGQHGRAGLIHDIDGREVPAVDGQRLPVLLRRVAVTLIVGIRLDDLRLRQILRDELLDPRPRDDVRPCGSPVCSLMPTRPVMFGAIFSYSLSSPAAERSRVK